MGTLLSTPLPCFRDLGLEAKVVLAMLACDGRVMLRLAQ
jgi:hypothetical protein